MDEIEKKDTELQVAQSQTSQLEFGDEIKYLIKTAGTLVLTEEEKISLYDPILDSEIAIRPDGQIYLPWFKYAERLNKAFTGVGWSLIPEGFPKIDSNNLVLWGFHLIIRGTYNGYVIGESQYYENNNRMSYGEACEAAKSSALTRLCKGIGIGNELWDKNFINRWLNAYAHSEWVTDDKTNKRKQVWKLKYDAFKSSEKNTTTFVKEITKADLLRIEKRLKECKTPRELQEYFRELTKPEQLNDGIISLFVNARKELETKK